MALSRSELKDIIKECILEVMLEGIRPKEELPPRSMRESVRPAAPMQPPVKKQLDNLNFASGASRVASQAQGRKVSPPPFVNELASAFPAEQQGIMKHIFEDTARNTLPAQLTADRSPAAALAQRADDLNGTTNVDPMAAFEGASNWADLAFAQSKK